MLSELIEQLPEVGDPPKPKLVFFFDEAHLQIDDAPKALVDKVEQKAVMVAAETFRAKPVFSTEEVITLLGIGEALVSVLEDGGVPSVVSRTFIRQPSSRVGIVTPEERQAIISASPVGAQYNQAIDRESAFEVLQKKADAKTAPAPAPAPTPAQPVPQPQYQPQSAPPSQYQPASAPRGGGPPRYREEAGPPRLRASNRESVGEAVIK